jgi:Helix-turn-helix domain
MPPRAAVKPGTTLDELAELIAALVAAMSRSSARREPHLTTEELATRLKLSPRTIEDWRLDGRGPKHLPDPVRYRLADVEAWEESRLVKPAST